jgi:hypothetical protein
VFKPKTKTQKTPASSSFVFLLLSLFLPTGSHVALQESDIQTPHLEKVGLGSVHLQSVPQGVV